MMRVLLAQPLDDCGRSHLDDEEIAAPVAGSEKHVAGLDIAKEWPSSRNRAI